MEIPRSQFFILLQSVLNIIRECRRLQRLIQEQNMFSENLAETSWAKSSNWSPTNEQDSLNLFEGLNVNLNLLKYAAMNKMNRETISTLAKKHRTDYTGCKD